MAFLAPAALAWLGSIAILLWLWRLAATARRTTVPSLVPFQHLLRRAARRRTRLVVTSLFFLQLAALLAMIAALARPVLLRPPARTLLAVLDTSASMQAGRAFAQARQALVRRVSGKRRDEQILIVQTAPLGPLLPEPTNDAAALARAARAARAVDMGGSLGAAARVGTALLPVPPDEILVLTDEPPPDPPEPGVRWVRVGRPAANVAVVGVERQGPLCQPADARAIVTLENFSAQPAPVTVSAHAGRELSRAAATLPPGGRQSVSLEVPPDAEGWIQVRVRARPDALAVDNDAWLAPRRAPGWPVLLAVSPQAQGILGAWLDACPALRWTTDPAELSGPSVVITDATSDHLAAAAGAIVLPSPASVRPVASHWVAATDHPVAAYLAPVATVSAALEREPGSVVGVPVIQSIARGQKTPLVITQEQEGRRTVRFLFDPASSPSSVPVLVTFFNSLRWVMGAAEFPVTGRPLAVGGFEPGRVQVRRPDGATDAIVASAGGVQYDLTTRAGVYRLEQGRRDVAVAVNFLDPLESNLLQPASTWQRPPAAMVSAAPARRRPQPLAPWLILIALLLLVAEWWRYVALRAPQASPS